MIQAAAQDMLTVRPLTREDLPRVVAIDSAIEGRSRRLYIERRLEAALREPGLHAQFAACDSEGLAGYILARVLEGEFGRSGSALRLELVGVRADVQRRGAGHRLLEALSQWGSRRSIQTLRTSAHWRNGTMLHWLDATGFRLAPETVLGLDVIRAQPAAAPEVALREGQGPGHEIDFGSPEANDHERMARGSAEIRPMAPADLQEIVRIDRAITGRDRSDYMAARLREAMEASTVRVSLVARLDGVITGFVMARADFGDFGRTQSVAVLDTIGVHPEYAHRGIGCALLAQLVANVTELQVERIETLVKLADLELLGFFQSAEFVPSQRLAFVRDIAG